MSKNNQKSKIINLDEEEINTNTKKNSNLKPNINNLINDDDYKKKLNTIHSGNESDEESDSSKLIKDNENVQKISQEKQMNTQESNNENEFEKIDISEFKNQIYVHPLGYNGAYKTIQAAIDAAIPKTKIIIYPAIYKEHLIIKEKSDIELTAYDVNMPPILSASNAPCIFIGNMIPGSTVKIAYFRLLHGGMRNEEYNNGLNNVTNDDTTILGNGVEQTDNEKSNLNMNTSYAHLKGGHNIFSNTTNLNQVDLNYNIDINVMEGIQCDNRGVVSAISVFNSTVMIINTQISLAFLTTETTKIIPGIYTEKCTLFLQSVLIKGNMEFPTCGIVTFDSSIKVSNSGFVKHKSGGILSAINFNNQIFINKTVFSENIGCGLLITNKSKSEGYKPYLTLISSKNKMDSENIKNNIYDPKTLTVLTESEYLHGPKKKAVFEKCGEVNLDSNLFNKNNGCGARIDNCLNLNVFKNKFTDNEFNGLEITDCEGLILLNEFVKNGENGLEIKTGARKSEIVISKNTLCENVCNGIIIKGKNNNCIIQNNEKITNNMKAGIGIYEFSFPVIKNNKISNNLYQGILIGHDSAADIEENKIFENLKANIAFGGDGAEKVKIVNNEIYRSRSEGIFGLEGLGGIIAKNKIFENNDGICIFNMKNVEISENDIYRNVRSGVLVAAESTPKMIQNQIFENKFIGCMFRDKSRGEYKYNIIEKNPTQCYYTNSCKDLIDDHNKFNTITGRIDTKTCVIF